MRALLGAGVASVLAAGTVPGAGAEGKFPIYLSMSYVGNGWQSEATNMISAMAKYYGDKIDLRIQVAGPVAQRQIQQINSMVQAGAEAIIVYPISIYATDATNATRVAMLPVGAIPDATSPYAPMGAPAISLDSTPMTGALALKLALQVLEGKQVAKDTVVSLDMVSSDNIKLCKEGSWKEMKEDCNVFDPKVINTDYVDNIFSSDTPEIGLKAAMFGEPEPKE